MEDDKRKLKLINTNVISGTTCYAEHNNYGVDCNRRSCKQWIQNASGHNCVLISAQNGRHTLQQIGEIYGLSRMRVCQIEKNILEMLKIKSMSNKFDH